MTSTSDPMAGGMPARASEWVVALSEAPDDPDLYARFEAWLAADPAPATDWDEMTYTLAVMGMSPPLQRAHWGEAAARYGARRTDAAGRRPDRTHAAPTVKHRRSPSRWLRRAAAAAAVAVIALALLPTLGERLLADHSTGTAEVQTVRLADGSVVRLAPESAIDVAFSGSRREVRLLRGEAFFEVAADNARPFVVATRGVETIDIGTAFNIRNTDGGIDVMVREGIVEIDGARTALPVNERLTAGEWARVAWTGAVERGRLPPQQVAAWLQGQLVVKHRPTGEIVDALRPYFRGLIVVRGESLARQPLTGVYSLSRPAEALAAVAAAQGAVLYRVSPWLLVLSES